MSSTGEVLPGSAETVSESPWSDDTWVNPTNIYGTGEASVTASSFDAGDQTYVLKAYNFNFSAIPDGATIDGVIVKINARYATAQGIIDLVQLLDTSRAKVGTNKAGPTNLTTSAADYTFGASNDKWSNELTSTWVKDADFGVAVGMLAGGTGNNNVDVYCDYVKMTVYYTVITTVAPDAASAVGSKVDPTVVKGSISITPATVSVVGAKVDPTVVKGSISFTPATVSAVGAKVDPTVQVSLSPITPSAVSAIGANVDPGVVLGSILMTPTPIVAIAEKVNPTVVLGSMNYTPNPAHAISSKNDPGVIRGSILLGPNPLTAIGSTVNPTVPESEKSTSRDYLALFFMTRKKRRWR